MRPANIWGVVQVKYLNNIVEQNHRFIKRMTKPMLNFKPFRSAKNVLAGIELMHMIRKGQLLLEGCSELSFANKFYVLAGQIQSRLRTWHPFLPKTRSSTGNATEPIKRQPAPIFLSCGKSIALILVRNWKS